ncbi:MAG: cupredoxin domain-containing protein, partial [Coriobacteriia bacterium]
MSKVQTESIDTKASNGRYVLIAVLVLLAFFASYRFAIAARGDGAGTVTGTSPVGAFAQVADTGTVGAGGASCACCGTSGSTEPVEGAAVADADGIQRITVDATNGYNPNVIKLAAGVPAEITFTQAQGCMAQVMSEQLDFYEDLTGGPKTVKLDGLAAGTYEFSCGMQMVF